MIKTFLFVLVSIGVALANDVLELTDGDFQSSIADLDIVLVKFYAPWCGHCKRLAPEFDKASTILKNNDPPVYLAKVDCTAETSVCGKFGVSGYPTLKIFRNGELAEDFNGPRESDGIVKYMRSKAGPSSKAVESVAAMEKTLGGEENVIVGFFADCEDDKCKNFKKLADSLSEDHRFAHTHDAEVQKKYGYTDDVVIFRAKHLSNKFESREVKYEDTPVLHKMKTWVTDNIHGLVGHRTQGNSNQYTRPLIVAYYDADYTLNPKGTNYWRNRVIKVAKKLSEAGKKVTFAIANINEFTHELSEYGIDAPSGDKPVVAARDAADVKYVMSEEFSVDNLEKFAIDFLDDKIEPYLKSEPVPEDNDEPVKVLVAKNFDEIVNDETKDVLIEFYAPWCGHCKNLAPKYDELATKLKDETNIVIAKMDATANDVPKRYQVQGFPTLFFAPADNKSSPKKYEGGREVKDFIKYLAKESTQPLKGYDRSGKKKKVPTATLR